MSFNTALLRVITEWNKDPIEDEWLFEKFRGQFISRMTSADAFSSIGPTVIVLRDQADESTAIEVLQTLIDLARQSDTTEVPSELAAQKQAVARQFSVFGDYAQRKLDELFRYYRL